MNLTAPEPVHQDSLVDAVARALHRPILVRIGRRPLRLALGRRAVDEFLLPSTRVLPWRLRELGFEHRLGTLDQAMAVALGSRAR